MRLPTRLSLCLAALGLSLLAGCNPPPESVQVKEIVSAPPDLAKAARPGSKNRGFQIKAFHLNQVWAGATDAQSVAPEYRAKITIWDYSDAKVALAELYFHDLNGAALPVSSTPINAKAPYQIHFPVSVISPILSTLRNTNEPIFLYYFEGHWAIGTYVPEPVGID